ncbi:MAG: redoxin domain-containing protein [Acidimicrobiales bacterium]
MADALGEVTVAPAWPVDDPGDREGEVIAPAAREAGLQRRRAALFAAAGVLGSALLAMVLFVGAQTGPGSQDVAPGINVAAANILQLDVLDPGDQYVAPGFSLTDQYSRRVSLGQWRGRPVVLSFNDDQCRDLCTLLAQDIVAADQDLGAAAKRVVFLSVNVNPFYPQVRYVRQWSDQHGLGEVRNWVFTTGPVGALKAVWRRYGIYVGLDYKDRTVVHGTQLFFVSPSGRVAAIGDFGDNAASTSLYAHAMAQMAVDLLPAAQRSAVGGPVVPMPTQQNATVGAPAPSFRLPLLTDPRRQVTSSALKGRYVVLNFWASTCTMCAQEMPQIEQAYRELGKTVAFVGVDVSGQRLSAAAFAKQEGATYPLVSDAQGSLAGSYRAPGLPFTVIVGPAGTVLVRHPGAMTTEQLVYVLKSEDPALAT